MRHKKSMSSDRDGDAVAGQAVIASAQKSAKDAVKLLKAPPSFSFIPMGDAGKRAKVICPDSLYTLNDNCTGEPVAYRIPHSNAVRTAKDGSFTISVMDSAKHHGKPHGKPATSIDLNATHCVLQFFTPPDASYAGSYLFTAEGEACRVLAVPNLSPDDVGVNRVKIQWVTDENKFTVESRDEVVSLADGLIRTGAVILNHVSENEGERLAAAARTNDLTNPVPAGTCNLSHSRMIAINLTKLFGESCCVRLVNLGLDLDKITRVNRLEDEPFLQISAGALAELVGALVALPNSDMDYLTVAFGASLDTSHDVEDRASTAFQAAMRTLLTKIQNGTLSGFPLAHLIGYLTVSLLLSIYFL